MDSKKKIRVGVVFGGRSGEHEVSLVSATSVMEALDKEKYEVVPIGITKQGRWIAGGESMQMLKSGDIPPALKAVLPADPTSKELIVMEDNKEIVPHEGGVGGGGQLDVIIPILHGPYGEDGTIQGLFELSDIPYVSAGVLGSSVSMDKTVQKQLCQQANIPIVDWIFLKKGEWEKIQKQGDNEYWFKEVEKRFGYPLFVKPANLGSSVAINKSHDRGELVEHINEAFEYDTKAVIEVAVPNARELEVSVLGNDEPRASVVGEVVPSNEFYDYNAKYVDYNSDLFIPAKISDDLSKQIQELAKKTFLACECSGMARIDFLYNDEKKELFLSELNTIPGFTKISMYPKLWEASGLGYSDLLDELIRLAIERHGEKSRLKTSYTPKEDWYK